MTTGVLLINLGTPDGPDTSSVRRYLREFLMDGRVIDIPAPARWLLVNAIIAPFRAPKSAHAYQQIWSERGSPLLVHGLDLAGAVQERLGQGYRVALGMRYQSPSIETALAELLAAGAESLVVLPLFPQYTSAATGSAVQAVMEATGSGWNVPSLRIITDFYDHPGFIAAQAAVVREPLLDFAPDEVVMSFHGLPERHVQKSWASGFDACDLRGACPPVSAGNRFCYRAQCYATARALAENLQLPHYEVSFQSRLGRDPWIRPYTDELLPQLLERGVKRVAVMCPAFAADCLETLEEIGLRARAEFRAAGGEDLLLLPCMNASDVWADAVVEMVKEAR